MENTGIHLKPFAQCRTIATALHRNHREKGTAYQMQTFPVISDMALFQPNTATGKLKAVMIPTRPNGFHCSMRAWPGPEGYKYSLSEHKFIKNKILNPSSSGQKYRYQTREDS